MLIPKLGINASRGLVARVREMARAPHSWMRRPTSRCLLHIQFSGQRTWGVCRWCNRTTEKRRLWHTPCFKAYSIAKGLTVISNSNRPVLGLRHSNCVICGGPGETIDHKTPLKLAALRGPREWIRAWHIRNLQWLCYACHKKKTACDVAEIAQEKKKLARVEVW